jgi:cardiolipin synthase
MKRKIKYNAGTKIIEREVNYIPVRYIIAATITVLEILAIIAIVVGLCYYVSYFYIAAYVTAFACELKIIASDDNPDYKVPWMLFVLVVPIAGCMLYFMFSSRKLSKKYIKRLEYLKNKSYIYDSNASFEYLNKENTLASSLAKMLCQIADTNLFNNTQLKYYSSGEEYFLALLNDLRKADKFIFMEYFIIEEGLFWNSILEVLKEKAKQGLEIKVVYDDIGCMSTLPGNYSRILKSYGIEATPFSRLRGAADSEFNNRSHRKITVIDGQIGYTGGINIADEYINKINRFGHWKDTGIRLEGEAVKELTKLFLIDYGINIKRSLEIKEYYYPISNSYDSKGYIIPFGDGPKPIYERRVGKSVIQNMFNAATKYAYITTPYLIIDNDLCVSIENAALRGVDVRIVVPHIPDKKIVFGMTKSFYKRLIDAGVKIYEYEPGFIHAKTYIVDDTYAMIGTINLDYRSLVHHFENGVWMYDCEVIKDMKNDLEDTLSKSIEITKDSLKVNLITRFVRAIVRIFAPML